ncbi:MAG: hypothetical protein M3O71_10790 [Bacteroidota bacterium]|nr:hypothetical protein [Bacteroidota bacterium]
MGYVETHGIKFYNRIFKGRVIKMGSPNTDGNLGYITQFDDPEMLTTIINNLLLAISGNFASIDDNDISYEECLAYITPKSVDFYNTQDQEIRETVPLQDICDLAIAWRYFLLQPPFKGTIIPQV